MISDTGDLEEPILPCLSLPVFGISRQMTSEMADWHVIHTGFSTR